LPSDIIPAFEDYVEQYSITDILFPYTSRFIEQLLSDSGKQAKLQKKVTASILRDTFVVRSLKQGMPLADVLRKVGLSEQTCDDVKLKYERLASQAI